MGSPSRWVFFPMSPLKRVSNLYFDPRDKIPATLPDDVKSTRNRRENTPLTIFKKPRTVDRAGISASIRGIGIHDSRVYMGASSDGKPSDKIPPQLTEPFLTVCHHLGLQLVLSYAVLCLRNWAATGDGEDEPDPMSLPILRR